MIEPTDLAPRAAPPALLAPRYENFPPELCAVPQWVLWQAVWQADKGKYSKVPYQVRFPAHKASSTNPATWATFAEARAAQEATPETFAGVGFVLTEGDPFVGIDLDHCTMQAGGALGAGEPADAFICDLGVAAEIEQLDTYTELSPSGTGVRLFLRGVLPPGGRKAGNVEVYDSGRFLTVTGHREPGTPGTVNERQAALDVFHAAHFGEGNHKGREEHEEAGAVSRSPSAPSVLRPVPSLRPLWLQPDETVLARATGAANGAKVGRLLAGDTSGYPSASEADLALCSCLAFWTGDAAQLDRLFRASGLMRPKWDERHFADGRTYGQYVVETALAGRQENRPNAAPCPPASGGGDAPVAPVLPPFLKRGAFVRAAGKPLPMLVEGVLPDKSLVLLTGKPKMGKSLMALDLAEAVCAGAAVWGTRPVSRAGAVVYLGMEDGAAEISGRFRAMGVSDADVETDELPFYCFAERIRLGEAENVAALEAHIAPLDPVLLIVDTAREALAVRDFNDAGEMTEKLRPLRELSRRLCTVLLVAHNRKASGDSAVDEIAGSNALTSSVDGWISARRKEDAGDVRRLFLDIDGRGGMRGEVVVESRLTAGFRWREVKAAELDTEKAGERTRGVVGYLRENGQGTVPQMAASLGVSEMTVARAIKQAVDAGEVVETGKVGKATLYAAA